MITKKWVKIQQNRAMRSQTLVMGPMMPTTGRSVHHHPFLPDPSALSKTATRTGKGKPWHLTQTMKPSDDDFPHCHYLHSHGTVRKFRS